AWVVIRVRVARGVRMVEVGKDGSEVAVDGIPALRRKSRTYALSRRSCRAAFARLDAWGATARDQRARLASIGTRAEPVTLNVSREWRTSWIVPAKICAVSTTATAIAVRPRKSSGSTSGRGRRSTARR